MVAVLKRSASWCLHVVALVVGRVQTEVVARRHGGGRLWVLDLDNTLADTWPSFLGEHPSERARLAGLEPLAGMIEATHHAARREGAGTVVLSHRAIRHWGVTRSWLRRHGITLRWWELVLVDSPADKVAHLRRWCSAGCDVVYWDDLTHGTERGREERYDAVIAAVAALPLVHHGVEEIAAVVAVADPGRSERVAALLEEVGLGADGGRSGGR